MCLFITSKLFCEWIEVQKKYPGKYRIQYEALKTAPNCDIRVKYTNKNKLHGLGPQANYTDRATAACRRS
jgi:hypothetical protein